MTYTWELDATVTALWCSALLLEVKVTKLSTWGLDDADLVGGGVIPENRILAADSESHLVVGFEAQYIRLVADVVGVLTGSSVSVRHRSQYRFFEDGRAGGSHT